MDEISRMEAKVLGAVAIVMTMGPSALVIGLMLQVLKLFLWLPTCYVWCTVHWRSTFR